MEIQKEHFEHWLMAQPGDRMINGRDCSGCFIHCYFKEQHCLHAVVATSHYHTWGTDGWSATRDIPQWLYAFLSPYVFGPRIAGGTYCSEAQARWRSMFEQPARPLPMEPIREFKE